MVEEADQPDLVVDLAYPNQLAGEDLAQVDFALADAEASAAGHADGAVMVGALTNTRVASAYQFLVRPGRETLLADEGEEVIRCGRFSGWFI